MSRTSRVLAGLAGFAVAFLFVMLATAFSPHDQPEAGRVVLRYDEFAFDRDRIETTSGSTLGLVNAGAVPVTVVVVPPAGDNVTVELAPQAHDNLTLADEGTYTLTVAAYDWSMAEVVVRDANPFVRFLEDLF